MSHALTALLSVSDKTGIVELARALHGRGVRLLSTGGTATDVTDLMHPYNVLLAERGWRVGNADVTVICERPKIGPHAAAMRTAIADDLGIALDCISVKATTSERLGFTGRGEGIAAQAVCLLVRDGG